MKKNFYLLAVLLSVCCMSLVSCGDDDDEGGGNGNGSSYSGVKTCYIEVDGKRYDFNHAYVSYYMDEVNIEFYDIDLMYYFMNPGKVESGMYFNHAGFYFEGYSEIPEGVVNNYIDDGRMSGFDMEFSTELDLYALVNDGYDDSSYSPFYGLDWDEDYRSQLRVTKLGDNRYRIEGTGLNMLCSDEDGGVSLDSRRTKADFYFEGSLEVMYDDRNGSAKNMHHGFGEWLYGSQGKMRTKANVR